MGSPAVQSSPLPCGSASPSSEARLIALCCFCHKQRDGSFPEFTSSSIRGINSPDKNYVVTAQV